jgi:hypothetical protein
MNRTKRLTSINLASAENVIQAAGYADQIGLPLNRHLTITWELAQCIGRVQDFQVKFFERYAKWIRYHGGIPAYVWAIENGSVWGHHSHILVHIPSHLYWDFKKMAPRWIDGEPDQSGHTKTFWPEQIRYGFGVNRWNSLKGVVRYILKGVESEWACLFGIEPRPDKAGIVFGKRVGTSQNIGRAARNKNLTKPDIRDAA